MRPVSCTSGMNSSGGIRPRSGMLPADQALDRGDVARRERELWLVVEDELSSLQRPEQLTD